MQIKNDRIYTLELLRFVAAFTIFFGHYVHFYMYFSIPQQSGVFYSWNNPYGSLAVPMFFMMSGAIFVHTYFDKIYSCELGFIRFMQRRFARLYPLHLLTLIIVVVFQEILFSTNRTYFIYQYNDIKHFFLNLFFISHWGFEDGHSFNAPIWSVSHEIVLYILFFAACLFSRFISVQGRLFFLACIVMALLQHLTKNLLAKSAFAFFVGAAIYFVLTAIPSTGRWGKVFWLALIVTILLLLNHLFSKHGLPYGATGPILLVSCLTFDSVIRLEASSWFCKISIFLGNISYSSYLTHFPVQLFFLLFSLLIVKLDFASTPVLLAYVLTVMSISVLSYRFFENPMKFRLSKHNFIIPYNKSKQ